MYNFYLISNTNFLTLNAYLVYNFKNFPSKGMEYGWKEAFESF